MKKLITEFIRQYVREYEAREDIVTTYGEPITGFADANHPYIQSLPALISSTHDLPQNVLPDARIIISYYVPFTKDIAKTNQTADILASPEWARAYEETNAMFGELNGKLIEYIQGMDGHAGVSPKAASFKQKELISDWSHRHIAYAAGLGSFGVNNMLITKKGCCGRYNSVVTNLNLEPDMPVEEEYCLYKKNGSCGVCVKNCPTGALSPDVFDRFKCYALCLENAKIYTEFGNSYDPENGESADVVGSEVCGKCVTASPCAFWNLK